jgi:RNA 2',3'-cyclic 3'-phosphodiesterase
MRLFIAVDLGRVVQARLGKQVARLSPLAPRARWTRPDGSAHVTLVFLGELDDALAPKVGEAVVAVAARHPPLVLQVGGGGAFGSSKRPTVLWTGISGDVEALAAMKADLERGLAPVGFKPETRPFRPHLTLARSRDLRGDAALVSCVRSLEGESLGEARIDQLTLYRSDLGSGGARHTPLVEPKLSGSASP